MPEITAEHMAKVRAIAKRVCGKAWKHWIDDVEGAGGLALALAARDWDGRGVFDGYALERVRWGCFDELDKLIGGDPGSRNVRSPDSLDRDGVRTMLDAIAYRDWQRTEMED